MHRHPIEGLAAELADPSKSKPVLDHGSWNGRWGLPSRDLLLRDALAPLGKSLPLLRFSKDCDAYLAQTGKGGRKELTWTRLSDADRKVFQDAAVKHWQI